MKFKSYYWAIFAAVGVVVVLIFVLPRVFGGSSASGTDPHSQEQQPDYTPQIEAYQDLLKANPKDAVALSGLGDVYMGQGNYSQAKDLFEQATSMDPGNALYHGRLGEAYYGLNMIDVALRELNTGLSIDPRNQAIMIDIGLIDSHTNQSAQARQMWQKAIDINPNNRMAHTAKELISQQNNPGSTTTAPPLQHQQGP